MKLKLFAQASDEELIAQMLAGKADAFERLYERRHQSVYRFALRMSGSATFAEDITQDVFLAFLRDAALFDAKKGTVASYLFGMTRNRVLRRLERERNYAQFEEEAELEAFAQFVVEPNPVAALTQQAMNSAVWQAVLALPPHYREIVVLCDLQELTYEAAAQIIGCPLGTVRSRLNRARAMLTVKLRAAHEPSFFFETASAVRS